MPKDDSQVSKSTAIFAAGTMVSRVLGLLRDAMIMWYVGEGPREAFLVAFRLTNTLRDIVGEGAMNAAMVPVLTETREKKSDAEFRSVVATLFGTMILVLGVVSILGVWLVPLLLSGVDSLGTITGGRQRTPEEVLRLVELGRWTFPYIFFIGLAVYSMGVSFTVHHYSTPSWAPALLNVAMIGTCLTVGWFHDPAWALVIGAWIGGIAQVLAQYIAMGRHTGVWKPEFRFNRPEVYAIFALMGPVALGQAAGQVDTFIDTLFAYKSGDGGVTALYNANRLVQLPLSIFGFATAAAILPAASRAATHKKMDQLRAIMLQGLRQSFFTIAPSMLGLIVLATPITRIIYEHGGFSAVETERSAIALIIFAFGLLAYAWVKVIVSAFYAVQDTRTPVIVATLSVLLNIALNFLLVRPYGFKGLAFATSVSYCANFAMLYILLWQRIGGLWDRSFISALIRMGTATAVMSSLGYVAHLRLLVFFPVDTLLARIVLVAVPMSVAVAAYGIACHLFGVEELSSFLRLLRRKTAKKEK